MHMMPRADVATLLSDGQNALLSGDKLRAQAVFRAILRDEPAHEEALLWLAGTVEPAEALVCLRKVLTLDPHNQQAQEGIEWVARTYGIVELAPAVLADETGSPPGEDLLSRSSARTAATSRRRVFASDQSMEWTVTEYMIHIGIIGAILGLLSLVFALRVRTLLFAGNPGSTFGWSRSLIVTSLAAASHGMVLLGAWWLLGNYIGRRRHDKPFDSAASLADAGALFMPGYFAAPALGLAVLGVGWSQQRWIPVVVGMVALLLVAIAGSGRRFAAASQHFRFTVADSRNYGVRIWGLPAAIVGIGTVLAGWLLRILLRVL
ncbi:MAG: hypothetical protein NVSMB42_03430 [Herpetosiphon sp.]